VKKNEENQEPNEGISEEERRRIHRETDERLAKTAIKPGTDGSIIERDFTHLSIIDQYVKKC